MDGRMPETPIFGMQPTGELQTTFFRTSCKHLADSLFHERGSRFCEMRPIPTWKDAFSKYITPFTEEVMLPFGNQWCVYTNNGRGGSNLYFALAHKLSIFAVRFAFAQRNSKYPYDHVCMCIADGTTGEVIHRVVEVATEGRKWEFQQGGTPMAFEDTSRYSSYRVQERLDLPLLCQYASALGVELLISDDLGPGFMIADRDQRG